MWIFVAPAMMLAGLVMAIVYRRFDQTAGRREWWSFSFPAWAGAIGRRVVPAVDDRAGLASIGAGDGRMLCRCC